MEGSYNSRCPAVKRLLKEAQELHEATEEYYAHPVEDNLFEWHFTVRGPPDTEFEGGVYHGRIIMPAEYPMKPPNIIFFTPNGRFEINKKICLSISGHHPETWQPSWSIRTALLAIIGFMPTPASGTIGSLDYTPEERAYLSRKSVEYDCSECGPVGNLLKERTGTNKELQEEAKQVSSLMTVTGKDVGVAMGTNEEWDEEATTRTVHENRECNNEWKQKLEKENSVSENLSEDSSLSKKSTETKKIDDGKDVNSKSSVQSGSSTSSSNVVTSDSTRSTTVEHSSSADSPPPSQNIHSSTAAPVSSVNSAASHSSSNPPTTTTTTTTSSLSLMANNILLSAAVVLLVALVLRRLFLLESESTDEMDEVLV